MSSGVRKKEKVKNPVLLFTVIGMMAAIPVPQAQAQSVSVSLYAGLNLHPKMFTNISIPGGVCLTKEIKNQPISFGIDVNGGSYYSRYAIWDNSRWGEPYYGGFGAQSLLFFATLNAGSNRFFGPVAGAGIGPAYASGRIGGVSKVFLQGNYSFGEKGNFGVFAQAYLNALVFKNMSEYVLYSPVWALYSPAVVVGCKFKLH